LVHSGATCLWSSATTGAVTNSTALAAGDLAINGFAIAQLHQMASHMKMLLRAACQKQMRINASSSLTGVTAKALETTKLTH
jgi:hypothetical protein